MQRFISSSSGRRPVAGATVFAVLATLALGACDQTQPPTAADRAQGSEVALQKDPGTRPADFAPPLSPQAVGSLQPEVTITGKVVVSIDGLGTNDASGIIQVEKPAGATVRVAYMAAASTGFSNRTLANGDVRIDGVGVTWSKSVASSISSSNSWADVTSLVKAKIDAAPAGRVNFTITEVSTFGIDGEVLAVVFDDPSQVRDNTVVLLFGAQNIAGDDFFVTLAEPIDTSDPILKLDMSLGISFGFQPGGQLSLVDVNGTRMSSSAGGQDDGADADGALLTVGGLDDTNGNPSPFAPASSPRTDDELYNLVPFVTNGATQIAVHTRNPSNDDNIFFAAFFMNLIGTVAIIPDPTPPACTLVNRGVDASGRVFLQVAARDEQSGLQSVAVTLANNVDVPVPPFTGGTTATLLITATKIDQSRSSQVELRVTDVAGNVTVCDPVETPVGSGSQWGSLKILSNIPHAEGTLSITNGAKGLTSLVAVVNGTRFEASRLRNGELRSLDISSAMKAGDRNTIVLRSIGPDGSSANVLIWDGHGDSRGGYLGVLSGSN